MELKNWDINEAMSICLQNSIKVYPICVQGKFKIEVNNNGKIKRYQKEVDKRELNKAITSTYIYFAQEVLKKKNKDATITK